MFASAGFFIKRFFLILIIFKEIRAEIKVSNPEQALKDHQSSENVLVSNSKTKLVIIATESRSVTVLM